MASTYSTKTILLPLHLHLRIFQLCKEWGIPYNDDSIIYLIECGLKQMEKEFKAKKVN